MLYLSFCLGFCVIWHFCLSFGFVRQVCLSFGFGYHCCRSFCFRSEICLSFCFSYYTCLGFCFNRHISSSCFDWLNLTVSNTYHDVANDSTVISVIFRFQVNLHHLCHWNLHHHHHLFLDSLFHDNLFVYTRCVVKHILLIQLNLSGSNIFSTIETCSRHG